MTTKNVSGESLKEKLQVQYIKTASLKKCEFNARIWTKEATNQLKESIQRFGYVDPILVNSAPGRENVVIGGNFRLSIALELGIEEVPVIFISIPNIEREKELNIRLNKNVGEFNWDMLADFGEAFLADIGFSSEELDNIFAIEDVPEMFDLNKELARLDINNIEIQKGDVWALGDSKLMCGDSTVEADMLKLFDGEKADFCLTDPPYILDYLRGKKKNGKPIEGFGYRRDRKYLETDELPNDFTEKWMTNIHAVSKEDFSIIVYENWKNIRTIWGEMEKFWKIKNMIVWHLPNRVQNFAAKYKFFNKHDIAMVGGSGNVMVNMESENELLQNEYEAALFGIQGKPHWENYEKGKKICPTDFIEYIADDKKHSGQGVIFGTKPLAILIPYIKILTKRGDLVVEPFSGSGSTLCACEKMGRRCFGMEKSPIYAEVIRKRWENLTGKKAIKL